MRREQVPGNTYFVNLGMSRMGDIAAYRTALNVWRRTNDTGYAVLRTNLVSGRCVNVRRLDLSWLLSNVVDAVTPSGSPVLGKPQPVPGFSHREEVAHAWRLCRQAVLSFLRKGETLPYRLSLNEAGELSASAIFQKHNIPPRVVTVQPLIDAPYNRYRNADPLWWKELIERLIADGVPVAVLGLDTNVKRLNLHQSPNLFFPHKELQSPQEALYFSCKSAVFIGGETGFSLWAAHMGVPVVSAMRFWSNGDGKKAHKDCDFRPLGFWAPVRYASLGGSAADAAKEAIGLFAGTIKESTPY